MQPHFFSWLETILKYLNILFTWQPYRHLHPHWGFLSHLPVTCSVKSTLEDNRRCLNQVLFPDTHSRNLIRLDRYSLIEEWIIDIAGLHLGNQTWEAIYTILPFYGMVTCKLLPWSGKPPLQRIFTHSWSIVYTLYEMWNSFKKNILTHILLSYLHFYASTYKSIYGFMT
jgi:hypothetical protein